MALHYGQEIFEGLKAYRQPDGSIATFRPTANAARFARSARRLAMAELPEDLFVESLRALVEVDAAWVPTDPDESLYFRPFMISTEVGLGVRPANAYTYLLIASPAGAYFPGGVKPVSVWLSTEFTRAAPGGTGEAKCAGNYAASLVAQAAAAEKGCDQVVWLDAVEHRWVEEMGGMNLYFVYGSGPGARIVTPSLTGTLLPGHHPRLAADRRPGTRLHRRGGQDLHRRLARGQRVRRHHRGVRVRHRRGDHAGRLGAERGRIMDRRRWQHRPDHDPIARATARVSRPARCPTPTTGCTGSPERAVSIVVRTPAERR